MDAVLIAGGGILGLIVLGLTLLGGYYLVAPDKAAIIVGHAARALGWSARIVRKRAVRGTVEGYLNTGRKAMNSESAGLLPYAAKLRWVDSDNAESFLKDDQVIVRMSFKDHPHRNLVLAALMYFRTGVLPESTQYLRKPVQKALALLMVDQMLSKARRVDSLNYFREEILRSECDNDDLVSAEFETLCKLHETGYFLRVLVPELIDYPLSTMGSPPRSGHYKETAAFLSRLKLLSDLVYIEGYLSDQVGPQGLAPLDFFEKRIRASFIIVGKRDLLDRYGFQAHVKRIRWCRDQGCRIVYLTGRAESVAGVAKAAEKDGIVEILELKTISEKGQYGPIRRGFARLRVIAPVVADEDYGFEIPSDDQAYILEGTNPERIPQTPEADDERKKGATP